MLNRDSVKFTSLLFALILNVFYIQQAGASPGLGLQWCSPDEIGKNGKTPARIPARTHGYDAGDVFYNARVGLFKDPDNNDALSWSFTDPQGEWLNSRIYNEVNDLTTRLVVNPQVELKVLCNSNNLVHRFIAADADNVRTLPAYYYSYVQSKRPFRESTKLCAHSHFGHYRTGLTNLSGSEEEACSFITTTIRAYQEGNGSGGTVIVGGFQYLAATPLKVNEETMKECKSEIGAPWMPAPAPLVLSGITNPDEQKTIVTYCKHYKTPDSCNVRIQVGIEYPEFGHALQAPSYAGCHLITGDSQTTRFSVFNTLESTRYERRQVPSNSGWEMSDGYRKDSKAGCMYLGGELKGYNLCRVNDPHGNREDPYYPYSYGYVIEGSDVCHIASSRSAEISQRNHLRFYQSTRESGAYEIYTAADTQPVSPKQASSGRMMQSTTLITLIATIFAYAVVI